ncbi:hypothetical protein [Novosphingobium kaempferiae]|uniref:hypothetical protein n=1 Tax=Novosphingobium kaempferiae TaxID=2896849 RepID=UPI001E51DB61|nr:hypothetical protein [Novosphingobium kaempferiae]
MDEKLLSLPWQIQLALGSGYAAYLVAYAGRRAHHTAVDVTFRSLAFGLVATTTLFVVQSLPALVVIPETVLLTVITGALWRRFGIPVYDWLMREADISWADDTPTAWQSITVCNNKHELSQLTVQLDDGTLLVCNDTSQFADQPFGPAVIGANGDVALYVNFEVAADGTEIDIDDAVVPYWGARMTYIPASKIARVSLRHRLFTPA